MTRIQLRHDTAENWIAANPTLLDGEVGVETDTQKLKIGDGETDWNSLDYFFSESSGEGGTVEVDIATVDKTGVVKPDGETILIKEDGTISANIPDVDTSNLANIDLSNITDLGLQNVLSTLANVAKTGSYNDLTDKPTIPNEYTLPVASTDILGGVKVDGTTISIADGVISAVAQSSSEFTYKKAAGGSYLKHNSSGLIIQAGYTSFKFTNSSTTKTKTFTFATPFSQLIFLDSLNDMSGGTTNDILAKTAIKSFTNTNFIINYSDYGTSTYNYRWIAFGY